MQFQFHVPFGSNKVTGVIAEVESRTRLAAPLLQCFSLLQALQHSHHVPGHIFANMARMDNTAVSAGSSKLSLVIPDTFQSNFVLEGH